MIDRQNIASGAKWEDLVGYSRAVKIGNLIEVSGTAAVDEHGAIVGQGDPYKQAAFIIQKIGIALHAAGAGFDNVIRTRIYVTDISFWERVGRAHGEVFGSIKPATSMVQVSALIEPGLLVEIEATAIVPDSQ